jgi:hypothetical protein
MQACDDMCADAQVNRLIQKQSEAIENERTALVAEQHKDLEKLIAAISASINRDLPLRMEDMVRREVAVLGSNLHMVVGPACHAAITDALPRELAGAQLQACSASHALCRSPAAFLFTVEQPVSNMSRVHVCPLALCMALQPSRLLVCTGSAGEGHGCAAARSTVQASARGLPHNLPEHPHPRFRGCLPDDVFTGRSHAACLHQALFEL